MRVGSDQLDGRKSRKQDRRPPLQIQGLQHERLVARVFEFQEAVSLLQGRRQEYSGR